MSEERFEFSSDVFGSDDRKSVEAVIHLLDRTYEQEHTGKSTEDVLYDFCTAYLKEAQRQETLSEEETNKRLKVIVQWYAQHARTTDGERIISEEVAKDIQDNWDEWLNGPETLSFDLFHRKHKKRKAQNVSAKENVEESAWELEDRTHHKPRGRAHVSKTVLAVIGLIVCFIAGMTAGWGLSHSGKMVQLTIGQSTVESDESTDETKQDAETSTAVMKWSMNVRSEPTTKNADNILTVLEKNDRITILNRADDNGWIKISCTDSKGEKISGYMQSIYDGETVYTVKQ